ncbi:MAG: alpha-E domain-containing protein, partial [Proteobacteria bacterium]|nr:alpha-E domain-containing protein [Pseudomonadota bacterium]
DEWQSLLKTAAAEQLFFTKYETADAANVVDFLLRDATNPSSVQSSMAQARQNARMVRTALTREVWEAVNDTYMQLRSTLARPATDKNLPDTIALVRQQSALVRGALHGSMLRNDVFDFARLGTFLERADNTARILDVKYYVLLPSISQIGSNLDNVQWETILRAVAGQRAYSWLTQGAVTPKGIADFLIFDGRMPRSLKFALGKLQSNLGYLEAEYGSTLPCHAMAARLNARLCTSSIDQVFEEGLHEFILTFLQDLAALGRQIETDYRFIG